MLAPGIAPAIWWSDYLGHVGVSSVHPSFQHWAIALTLIAMGHVLH